MGTAAFFIILSHIIVHAHIEVTINEEVQKKQHKTTSGIPQPSTGNTTAKR